MTAIWLLLFPVLGLQEMTPTSIEPADTVLQAYQRYLAGDSLTYEEKFDLARSLANTNRWPEAIEFYTRLITDYPQDPDLFLGRGLVYAWEGRFPEAEADFAVVTEQVPGYIDAWMALGNLYLWWEKYESAEECYSKCVDLQPDNTGPLIARAKVLRAARKFPQARQDLYQARERGGDPEEIGNLLRDLDRMPSSLPWEPFILREVETFSDLYSDWRSTTLSVKRELPFGSLAAGGLQAHRFDQDENALFIDSYINLRQRGYANLRLQGSSKHNILPTVDLTGEYFQGVGEGWEVSGSYRFMMFDEARVNIYGLSLSKYVGQWYLRGQLQYAPGKRRSNQFARAGVRRYLAKVDDFVEIGAGAGREVEWGQGEPMYSSSYVLIGRGQVFIKPRLGITLTGSYQKTDKYERVGIAAGIITRW
ncbi:MAG: YaiO family outer membrane beta-barrel protein [Fidelibacterota bacterium]|nr:MAG: YaiO family outer membrane beta-barrel protein [Candidatus Neomarinimicrobiota bacterium]